MFPAMQTRQAILRTKPGKYGLSACKSLYSVQRICDSAVVIRKQEIRKNLLKNGLCMLLFVIAHVTAGTLAAHFFSPSKLSTIFWPASGIAIAAILLGGIRYLPVVIVASLIASAIDGRSWPLNAIYAVSNGLEVLLAWSFIVRFANIDISLKSARDYIRLILIAGVLVPVPGSLISAAAIQQFVYSGEPFWHHAQTWWMGNSFGIILLTPLILIWRTMPDGWTERRPLTEALAGILVTIVAGAGIVFGGISFGAYSMPFVGFVSASWAAIRFGRHVTLIITAIIAAYSITALHISLATATRGSRPADFLDTWLFLVTLSTVGMALATTFNERRTNTRRLSELIEAYQREEKRRRRSDAAVARSHIDFQRLVETSAEGVWTIDAGGKTTFVNNRMAEMLGYTQTEMLSKTFFELMPPEDQRAGSERLERRNSGIAEAHECKLVHKNGSLIWTFMNTNPILDAERKIIGALAMVTDISERKKAEAGLRESEDRYRKIVEGISDSILVHQSGIIVYANPAAAAIMGFENATSLIGLNGFSFVHPDDRTMIIERAQKLIQGKSEVALPRIRQKLVRPDGSIIRVESTSSHIRFNNRDAILVIAREITADSV